MGENLMNQYIHEEQEVLLNILENKRGILGESVSVCSNKEAEKIYIIGSGTSHHAALAAKDFISNLLNKQVIPMYPTRFEKENIQMGDNSVVIGISQGGRSLSTIGGINKAKNLNLKTIGISEFPDSDLAGIVDYFIPLTVGSQEKSGAKTKGYVATILTLMLLGLESSILINSITKDKYEESLLKLKKTIDNVEDIAIESEQWYERVSGDFLEAKEIMVIGYGVNYPTALEGALKLLETARFPVTGYEMEEYMHGVYNCINPDSYLIFLASNHEDKERMLRLKDFLSDTTEHCYVIGKTETYEKKEKDLSFDFFEDKDFSSFEYIIPVQILASLLSIDKGINPSIPKFPDFHTKMGSKVKNI